MNKHIGGIGKRILSVFAAAALTACGFSAIALNTYADEASVELYVSPSGNDSTGSGAIDSPFATLQRANDAISEMQSSGALSGGVTVYLREGTYQQTQTLKLNTSGSYNAPVVYKAYGEEKVSVIGGITLSGKDFYKPDADTLESLHIKDSAARAAVVAYDLGKAGAKIAAANELYYNGIRATVSRYPNKEDDRILFFRNTKPLTEKNTYVTDGDEIISTWKSIDGVQLFGHFDIDWVQSQGELVGYDPDPSVSYTPTDGDMEPKLGRMTVKVTSSNKNMGGGNYYYSNIIDEMDVPGEYYIDTASGTLYIYPPENFDGAEIVFSQLTDTLVDVNANYLTIDGINFGSTSGDALVINGDYVTVQNCNISGTRKAGINITGSENLIYNNEIAYTGSNGVQMNGGDGRWGLASNSTIDNNTIHHFGQVTTVYAGAIGCDGIGFVITHNEIYQGPHLAYGGSARDVEMRYNYFHDVCREGGDAGVVYVLYWRAQNFLFESNVIANVYNPWSIYYSPAGFYCDDGGAYKTVRSNIFYNIAGTAMTFGGGKDNIIEDNIVLMGPNSNSNTAIGYDARTWTGEYYNDRWASYFAAFVKAMTDEELMEAYGRTDSLWTHLLGTEGYGTKQWAYRFPKTMLYKTTSVYSPEDKYNPNACANAVVRQNVCAPSSMQLDISKYISQFAVVRDNYTFSSIDKLGFKNYAEGDWSLSEDSVIYREISGFHACDFAQVGVQDAE